MKPYFCVFALLFLAVFSSAQQKNTLPSPTLAVDAKRIFQKAAEAVRKIKIIEYAEQAFHAEDKENHLLVTSHIRQARAAIPQMGFLPGKFVIEGTPTDKTKSKFAYSYDGATFRVLDDAEKVIQVVKSPTPYIAGSVLGENGLTGIPQYTQDEPFKQILEAGKTFVYEGTRKIGDVECDVVAVTQTFNHPALGTKDVVTRWFFGRADNLPRGNEISGVRKEIKILEIKDSTGTEEYFIPVPNGYSEKLITGKESKTKGLLAPETLAPAWTLRDASGKEHSLSEYRGKIVVLDFWGTWCVPCRKTMPDVQKLYLKFKDRDVVVIGVSVADTENDPAAFMKRLGLTYNLLVGGDAVAEAYKAVQLPTLYVVGFDGTIIHAEYGYRENTFEELSKIIERYLAEHKK